MSTLAVRSSEADNANASSAGSERLSTPALCAELARLAEAERRTEWLLCRHLAELADRFERRDPVLCAYADVYQLARLCFAMGVRRTRERVRIGRALRDLPQIESAFVEGAIGYARAREVTRVANAADEAVWLQLASDSGLANVVARSHARRSPLHANKPSARTMTVCIAPAATSIAATSGTRPGSVHGP